MGLAVWPLFLLLLVSSCHHDDDMGDLRGLLDRPQPISVDDFNRRVLGSAWYETETHAINADGSLDAKSYYEEMIGASPSIYYFATPDTLTEYYSSDAIPAHGFSRKVYQYDATRGVVDTPSDYDIQLLSLQGDRMIVKVCLGVSGTGVEHYGVSEYRRMAARDLQYFKDRYTYDFDARGKLQLNVADGDHRIDGTTFDFDVLSYNRSFSITPDDEPAGVDIQRNGQHVHVKLLRNGASFTVTDGTFTKQFWLWTDSEEMLPKGDDYELNIDTLWVNARGEMSLTPGGEAIPPYEYIHVGTRKDRSEAGWDKNRALAQMIFSGEAAVEPGERHYRESDFTVESLIDSSRLKTVAAKAAGTDTPVYIWLVNRYGKVIQRLAVHLITRK